MNRESDTRGAAVMSGSIAVSYKTIASMFAAGLMLAPLALWNRYVFSEENLPFLLLILLFAVLLSGPLRFPRGMVFPAVAFAFALFISYAWIRLDNRLDLDLSLGHMNEGNSGASHIVNLLLFYLMFVTAALLFYRAMRLSLIVWLLVLGYIVGFIVRNSLDIAGLQEGFNLSPGFVLLTLVPFLFLDAPSSQSKPQRIPELLLFLCMLWLALIGARTATMSLMIFYLAIRAWPIITRNRAVFFGTFWGMLLLIAVLNVVYLMYATIEKDSLIEDSGIGILQKRIGTRLEIWAHLLSLIIEKPLFGYGTEQATSAVTPLSFLEFSLRRDNLSAHSTYYELLFRIGVFGLAAFVLVLFTLWRLFWAGRGQWSARVAGAFLLAVLFFCATAEFLVFSTMALRSGFGWIILGIGAGASLRATRAATTTAASLTPTRLPA